MVLATEIGAELLSEGIARELIHVIQTKRKELDLNYTTAIVVGVVSSSPEVAAAVAQFNEMICGETLADQLGTSALKSTGENTRWVSMRLSCM